MKINESTGSPYLPQRSGKQPVSELTQQSAAKRIHNQTLDQVQIKPDPDIPGPCISDKTETNSKAAQQGAATSPEYRNKRDQINNGVGLNSTQQQFILKFCRQLASVIKACEQSESAEIEVGHRAIGEKRIRVKLQAQRE